MSEGASRVGTRFGKYELIALLGKGGMGEVYEARDIEKGRNVAVKILRDQYAQDERFRARFLRESRAAAILQEPHVVPIHDWGEVDGNLYIDMRLVHGQTLHDLARAGGLEPTRAVAIVEQVASALDAAHAAGLIHRDVKPQNIIVTPADFAYLVDFGIAEAQGDTRLTVEGTQIGSFAYMAPERFNNEQCTPAADIYSLACVLYEALTGATPFPADSYESLIAGHISTRPPQPSRVNPRVPAALDDVIARGMAKEPDDRYGSAGALGRAAQRALASAGTAAPQPDSRSAPWAETMQRTEVPSPSPSVSAGVPRSGQTAASPTAVMDPHGSGRGTRRWPLAVIGAAAALLLGAVALTALMLLWNRTPGPSTTAAAPITALAPAGPATVSPPSPPIETVTRTVLPPEVASPGSMRNRSGVVVGTCTGPREEGFASDACGLQQRDAPFTTATRLVPDALKDGTTVEIVCQTAGDLRSNPPYGSSRSWYRLPNGAYVPAVYISTGTEGIPTC